MTPHAEQPTHLFVRNLLKIPDPVDGIYDELSSQQQLGLCISRVAEDIARIQINGCDKRNGDLARITKLERFIHIAKGVIYGVAGAGAIVGFVFMVIEFILRHEPK